MSHKKEYLEPQLFVLILEDEDVLTASGDNDAHFMSVGGNTWIDDDRSNYY